MDELIVLLALHMESMWSGGVVLLYFLFVGAVRNVVPSRGAAVCLRSHSRLERQDSAASAKQHDQRLSADAVATVSPATRQRAKDSRRCHRC